MAFSSFHRAAISASAVALLLAAGVAHSTGTRQIDGLFQTAAEEAFPDAPYGVDPTVTGPTSVSFASQQALAGCETAVWPDTPLACYPQR